MKLSSSKIVSLLISAAVLVAAKGDADDQESSTVTAAAASPTTTTTTTTVAKTDYDVESSSESSSSTSGAGAGSSSLTFTALTKPLPLFPGEVTNTWHHLNIPDGPIAISEFFADIVEYDPTTGNIVEVPLSDAYLHHHVVYSEHKFYANQKHWWSPMKPPQANRGVGFGAGTESRGTKQKFPFPYRFTTIKDENELLANVHVINTRTMSRSDAHHCLECPCTKEDRINLDSFGNEIIKKEERLEKKHHNGGGWFHWGHNNNKEEEESQHKKCHHNSSLLEDVIERNHNWTRCNTELVEEHNTACSPDTYYGGLICCEHGEFCLDNYYMSQDDIQHSNNSTQSVYYLRYTLTYTPVTPEIQPLSLAACCDASGNLTSSGNIEYDIPKCDDDDDSVCIHELETIQELHGASARAFGTSNAQEEEDIYVDVVYMVGHLHRGGMSMKAYIESTGEVLCESLPTYGTGQSKEIGNEPNYINSMSSCTFNPPRRLKTTEKLRIVGKYNSTTAHTGVMSLFYIAIADVPGQEGGAATTSIVAAQEASSSDNDGGFWKTFQPIAIIVAAAIVIAATWHVVVTKSHRTKSGYESLPGENQSLVV